MSKITVIQGGVLLTKAEGGVILYGWGFDFGGREVDLDELTLAALEYTVQKAHQGMQNPPKVECHAEPVVSTVDEHQAEKLTYSLLNRARYGDTRPDVKPRKKEWLKMELQNLAYALIGFMVGVIVMAVVRDWRDIFNFEATAYDAPVFPVVDEPRRPTLVADHGRTVSK